MRKYLIALLLTTIYLFGLAAPAMAVEYGGVGGVPANPDPANPRTSSIFVYKLGASEVKEDGLKVANNSSQTKTLEIYATDSEISSGGSFACKQKVDARQQVGSWITFAKSEVTLEPNTNEVVPFTVNMPAQIEPGEHDGCIVIQEKDGVAKASGNGVVLGVRSALRVVITAPGDIKKDLLITDLKIVPNSKKHVITLSMKNNGNVSLDTDVKVEVRNMFGKVTYHNGGVYPILAEKRTFELNFEMQHTFWGGLYKAQATAEYNSDPKTELGQQSNTRTKRTSPTKYIVIMPKLGALVIYLFMLALLGAGIWLKRKKKTRKQHIGDTWKEYTVKKQDTLHHLADKHDAPWKTIVKVNKLKPPYKLETGSTIKLPPLPSKSKSAKDDSKGENAEAST